MNVQIETQIKIRLAISRKTESFPFVTRERGSFSNSGQFMKNSVEILGIENLTERLIKYVKEYIPTYINVPIYPNEIIDRKIYMYKKEYRNLTILFSNDSNKIRLMVDNLSELSENEICNICNELQKYFNPIS